MRLEPERGTLGYFILWVAIRFSQKHKSVDNNNNINNNGSNTDNSFWSTHFPVLANILSDKQLAYCFRLPRKLIIISEFRWQEDEKSIMQNKVHLHVGKTSANQSHNKRSVLFKMETRFTLSRVTWCHLGSICVCGQIWAWESDAHHECPVPMKFTGMEANQLLQLSLLRQMP